MRRTASVLLAGALALGAVATTDGEDTTDHPCHDAETGELAYPEQQVFFKEGDGKVGNTSDSPHPWSTEEPTSVTGGAGAGQLALSSQADAEATTTVFEGTFSGCIDTMLFDLWSFDPANRSSTSADAQPNDHTLSLAITIDGIDVYANGTVQTVTTYGNEAMGPNLNRFAVELSQSLEEFQEFLPVPLDGEHTVRVSVAPYYINTGAAVVYTWDTSETPSGITFNGAPTDDHPLVN